MKPQITIPKNTEHAYQEIISKATVLNDGMISMWCGDCGTTKSQTPIYRPSTFSLSATTYNYSGEVCTPTVTVKDT